jgi:hypothetical protein
MIEGVRKDVSAVADLVTGNNDTLDNHEKRIERLEDTAGLPELEPAIES